MSYYVRPMCGEDIDQVTEIDREAFPTQWPLPNYQRELRNELYHYIVVCDDEISARHNGGESSPGKALSGLTSGLKRLLRRGHHDGRPASSAGHYVTGFVGFWLIADEAHVTSIAVREAYRQHGIGELLLLSVVEQVIELNARTLTLEVRVSNTGAQNLYSKYGFSRAGMRRGYYTDNREDALIMSTDDITTPSFQAHLQQLKQAHSRKWGIASSHLPH